MPEPAGRGAPALAASAGAVLVAAVVVGASAGVAVPHAGEAGLTVLTVTSGTALLLSLVLLVGGLIALGRSLRGWRRAGAVVGAFVVSLLVVDVLAIPVAACTVPATALGARTPASAGLEFVDATTTTRDGVRLSGWYLPSTSGAAVVLLHGAGSTRSAVLDHAIVLARQGFGVLALDARGHGSSGGRAMDLGWYGDDDVEAGVTFLSRVQGVDPHRIALVGLSMGGEEAIGAAAADPRVRAVVAEGVTGRQAADLHWLSDRYGWRGAAQELIQGAQTAVARVLTRTSPPTPLRRAVRAASPRPALLVVAGDVADEQHAAADLHAAAPGTVEVWTVRGSAHTAGLRTAPVEWQQRVTAFLVAATR